MTKFAKLKTVVAVAGACAALFAAAPANAYVYATSHLDIQNLVVDFQHLGVSNTATVTEFTFDLTNTAQLLKSPGALQSQIKAASCSLSNANCGVTPVLNADVAVAPGSSLGRAEDNYAFLGQVPGQTYSHADSIIDAATLINGTPTATRQIAESLLNVNGSAAANTEVKSNTTLKTTFTLLSGGTDVSVFFEADPDQQSLISELLAGAYSAQTNMNVSLTLTRTLAGGVDGGSVAWTPKGATSGNDCLIDDLGGFGGVTCAETFDTFNLNSNTTTGSQTGSSARNFEPGGTFGSFGVFIAGLDAGDYALALNALVSTSITRTSDVPEPGALALVGIALAGLGLTAQRRSRKQA